jgi:hypothetical protein
MKIITLLSGSILLSYFLIIKRPKEKINVDFYLTPRNANYGWYNNGIENFAFRRKSVKVSFDKRSYATITEKDSLYELYYKRQVLSIDILDSMIYKSQKVVNNTLDIKRIAIIVNKKPKSDSIFIDRNYNFFLDGKLYRVNKKFSSYLESLMPIEMRENWTNDLPARL